MENILPYLDRDALALLRPRMQLARVKPGQRIIREGAPAPALFIIRSGEVDVLRQSGGYDIFVTTLATNSIFGESAFLDAMPASASVRARTESDLIVFSPQRLSPLFEESPSLFSQFYRSLALQLSRKLRAATTSNEKDPLADRFGDLPAWEII